MKKYFPLIALVAAASAFAQSPAGIQSVGQSQQAPQAVAQCIAKKWADNSQQQVISQATLANEMAVDVYVPGQQPPSGAAAVVRPSNSGKGTWVGFRSGGATGGDATSAISACL
jgi:hypothetical protein